MRAETADLAEDHAVVTQADVAQIGDGQPSLRARHPDNSDKAQRGTANTSALRSTMPSDDEYKSGVTVEYALLEEGEDAAHLDSDRIGQPASKTLRARDWVSIFLRLWLAITVLYFAVKIAGPLVEHFSGERSSQDDPFGNWGKAGTGTENLSWYPTDFMRDVVPIPCHSHNDYWRKIPFFSAIFAGCTGVEADVWLRNGDLLVGHDTASLQPNRTFQSLYVNPLVEILTRNNPDTEYYNGTSNGVFDTDPEQPLVFLIDLKTDGLKTWPWVMKQLDPLRERGWLSYWEKGEFHQRAVTVVGTGNTPFSQIVKNSTYRDAFFDAPLDGLENSPFNSTNSYYASVSFWDAIGAVYWKGTPNDKQLEKIRLQLREAHSRGLKARYWKLPDWPIHVRNNVWKVLVQEGIDMLNVDDLAAATKQDWTKPGTY